MIDVLIAWLLTRPSAWLQGRMGTRKVAAAAAALDLEPAHQKESSRMCRLLGVVASEPESLHAVLDSSGGFCELSHKHSDGWGVAWHDGGELEIVKGALPAWTDPGYDAALGSVSGDAAVVHLRRASVGIPVLLENCHPFGDGTVAFEHNGQFRVSDRLRSYYADVGLRPCEGTTDSELYFGLVLDAFPRTGSWPSAICEAASRITRDLWVDDPGDNPDALNCLLLTPDALYGFSQSEPSKLQPDSTPDTYVLRLVEREGAVIVTSTHWEVVGASEIPERTVVQVDRGTLAVTIHPGIPLGGRALG
jgi:predicted glutamine amidotransferase